jgi:hypothetical protein
LHGFRLDLFPRRRRLQLSPAGIGLKLKTPARFFGAGAFLFAVAIGGHFAAGRVWRVDAASFLPFSTHASGDRLIRFRNRRRWPTDFV